MRRILSFFILAGMGAGLAAGLAGCRVDSASRESSVMDKGTSSAALERTAAPPASKPAGPYTRPDTRLDTRPLVVCFGDSLTAGFGADEGQSYPDFLQKDLDRDGYRYRVVNEGISGNTTKDGVDRLAGVAALKPAVVVLEFGGNDGLRGFKTQTTRTNLSTMIAALQKSGAKVVLAGITLPPDYGPDYVNAFTANYPALAKKYDVPVLPFILQHAYGVPGMIQADGIHATDQGNEVVAKNVLPLVEPLLKK